MRKFLLKIAMSSFMMILGLTVFGQVTNSSLTGVVIDKELEMLVGATVQVVHVPSGLEYGTVTDVDGRFSLPNLKAGGPYSITVSYVGFGTVKYTDIFLKLGEPFTLVAELESSSETLQEVVISATSSTEMFNSAKTGAATNVSNKEIAALPTISRSLTDYTRLTPQANGNGFGGRDGRYNNVQIDGANFNNGFGLNSDPLPGGGSNAISLDAIQEVSVNIAPYDVRQSGFTGAGINAISRSGTNEFSGSVYTFWRNQDYAGTKAGPVDIEVDNETSSVTRGFRLGGPVIKNKLFFFANAEFVEDLGINPSAVNLWKPSQDGIAVPDQNIARPTVTDLEAVRDHLINNFGYDPGRYQGYANESGSKSTSLFARLDYNISSKHRLSLRYSSLLGTQDNLVNGSSGPRPRSSVNRVSDQSIAFESTQYATENIVKSVALELSSYFTSNLSNQFIGTYSKIQAKRSSASSQLFPTIDIWEGGTNYITAGYDPFTYGNDVINDNYSFVNNLTYNSGRHEITAGLAFDLQTFGNQFLRVGASYYRYNSVADFLTTGTGSEVAPIMFAVTYPYEGADPYAPITLGTASVYGQDKITVNNKLTVTAGLRIESPIYLDDMVPNTAIDELEFATPDGGTTSYKTQWPNTKLNFSPRVGFTYDVKGDGSLKLRGGTGLFYGRMPFVWLTNMPTGSGVISNNVEPSSYAEVAGWIGNITLQTDPYYYVNNVPAGAESVFIANPTSGYPSSLSLVDNDLKMPSVWRTSFGADLRLPSSPITLSADFMYTRDVNAVYQFNANRGDAPSTMSYGNDNRDYGTPARINAALAPNNVRVLTNTDEKGNIFNATVGATINGKSGFFGSLFYTYTYANEITSNPGSSASSAIPGPNVSNPNDQVLYNSSYAVPHRIVGSISYKLDYADHLSTTFSLFYNGSNQGRYSYTYSSDFNADGINADLLYIPADDSEIQFQDLTVGTTTFTAEEQLIAFNTFVNADEYLSSRRGKYVERNSNVLPWLNRFDFRLLQDIYTNIGGKKNTLQLSVDIFNFGNLLSRDWGISQSLNNAQNLLRPRVVNNTDVPVFTMNTITDSDGNIALPTRAYRDNTTQATTWYMQLGIRYIFN